MSLIVEVVHFTKIIYNFNNGNKTAQNINILLVHDEAK